MFFASNSILETLHKTALDISYTKSDGFRILVILHTRAYERILKETLDYPDSLKQLGTTDKGNGPAWKTDKYQLIFIRSDDMVQEHIILVEDYTFHTITIQHGEEKNTLPGS